MTTVRKFASAYANGLAFPGYLMDDSSYTLEQILQYATTVNPYKTAKARAAFINGVSCRLNSIQCYKNRAMNEKG